MSQLFFPFFEDSLRRTIVYSEETSSRGCGVTK